MKKIKLICCLLFLCGCTSPIEIEEDVALHIAVENEAYGNAITALWDETYPEYQHAVTYQVIEEKEILSALILKEEIPYDVFLIQDEDVATAFEQIKTIPIKFADGFEIVPNSAFNEIINEVKNVYYPLMAEGMLYAINTTKAKSVNVSERAFENFESLYRYAELKPFYYLDNDLYSYPLMSSDLAYMPNEKTHLVDFEDEAFLTSISNLKEILRSLSLQSDPASFDNWFITEAYLSGLIGSWMQADLSEELNGTVLKYQKLPKIHDMQPKTLATSKGYVINEATLYPNAALKLIELMHSQAGMQVLVDTSQLVPLIPEEQVELFTMLQPHQEEKIIAMNGAMQRNLLALYQNPQVGAVEIFNDPTVQISIKKYILDGATLEEMVAECSARSDAWLLEQSKNMIE